MLSDAPDTVLPAAAEAVREIRNGTAPAEPPRFRLRGPLYHRVTLKDEYSGVWADMLLNPGLGLLNDLSFLSGMCAHLHRIIRAWNLDAPDGSPLPIAPEGVALIEPNLSAALMGAWQEARELSKSHRLPV